ncbi:antitoxin [Epidermidibacterium keratini]
MQSRYDDDVTMIQIRNVPDDVHRRLKARAAMEGVSLSELALSELTRSLDRPTRRELLDLVASREQVRGGPSSATLVERARDAS